MKEVKSKIQNLVQAINMVYKCQNELEWKALKFMEVDFWTFCNVYVQYMNSTYKKTMYRAMNYKEVLIFLEWYLEGLDY